MTTGAVVLAAGRGTRFGATEPKQFALLAGRPLVTYSVETFVAHRDIDSVWVVGGADDLERLRLSVVPDSSVRFVAGGLERTDSVAAAVAEADGAVDRLLVHDAARPLVPAAVVSRVIEALDNADAVATVIPATDTMVELDRGQIVRTPDRSTMFALQTPQGFRTDVLAEAYRRRAGEIFTDDVSLVAAKIEGSIVRTVPGDPTLLKVTTRADLLTLEAWLAEPRT